MEQNQSLNGFKLIKDWISTKWKCGCLCVSLWTYLIACVFVLGGMGIWFEIFCDPRTNIWSNIAIAMLSSSWAIAGTASVDLIFSEKENYIICIPITLAVVIGLLSIVVLKCCILSQICAAILTFFFAGMICFLVNAGKIKDVNPPNRSGGDVQNALSGNTHGVRV